MAKYPNWFEQTAKANFEEHLKEYAGKPNLQFLQIGAFTGDASVWLLDNILTDKSSNLTDIDTWLGSDEDMHDAMDFQDVFKTYWKKIKKYENIKSHQCSSEDFLRSSFPIMYDFIYIDGDHTANGVLTDAVMAFGLLKPGGIMAFDDYTWQSPEGALFSPPASINFFFWAKQLELTPIVINSQLWVRKNDNTQIAQG